MVKRTASIRISAWGTGLAAILGAGAVLLAMADKSAWGVFLLASIVALAVSIVLRKIQL